MSKSLVRTSLALFGYEDDLKKDKKKKRKNKSNGALDLIPINHRITTKTNKKEKVNLGRSSKLTVQEAKKRLDSKLDPTEENVRRLLLLGGEKRGGESSVKLLDRAQRKPRVAKGEKKPQETTAFTEEDFKKFEEEYHEL